MHRPSTVSSAVEKKRLLTYLICMLPFLVICAGWLVVLCHRGIDFWDARIYGLALRRVHAGGDPYDLTTKVQTFLYPPVFLKVAVLLSRLFPGRWGWYAYVLMPALGVLAIPWILATTYIRSAWLTPAMAMLLFTFQPRLFGEIALLTGNFGVLLHFLVLAAGIPGIRQNKWLLLYLAVIFASLVKPPFLAFLLLPLLVGRKQLWQSSLTVAIVAADGIHVLSLSRVPACGDDSVRRARRRGY